MDVILVVIFIVVIVLVIGVAGFVWGSYHLARRERQNALPRPVERSTDHPLPSSVEMPPLTPPSSGYILWGHDGQHASEPKHLQWGEETEQLPPRSHSHPDEDAQCLLTKTPINKAFDNFIECPHCGVLYLTESWHDYGASQCLNCKEELS